MHGGAHETIAATAPLTTQRRAAHRGVPPISSSMLLTATAGMSIRAIRMPQATKNSFCSSTTRSEPGNGLLAAPTTWRRSSVALSKIRDVIRMISADGWYLARQRGSHRQFRHPVKPGLVTVAGKPGDDLATGTLNSVLKQAGLK